MLILSLLFIGIVFGFIVDKLLARGDPLAVPFTFFSLISTITALILILLRYN